MIVVVDSNILFSASISPNGRIAEILYNPLPNVERISCYYAFVEIFKHQPKILQLSKQPLDNVIKTLYSILQQVRFDNEALIEPQFWEEADRLTKEVDSFDISYVALTLQTGGWLWTGDKKLTTHLRTIGFERVLNTEELFQMVISR